jgi:hypothetical protein
MVLGRNDWFFRPVVLRHNTRPRDVLHSDRALRSPSVRGRFACQPTKADRPSVCAASRSATVSCLGEVRIWVNSVISKAGQSFPVYPDKQTFLEQRRTSHSGYTGDRRNEKRPPTEATSIVGVDFDHFNARLLQYHGISLALQPVISPASVHSA